MVTAAEFIHKVKIPLSEGWGYIWGTWGQMWTKERQEKATREMTKKYGARWIGHYVTDCSGLLRWALSQLGESIPHSARYQYSDQCGAKGILKGGRREDGKPVLPGTAVFLKGTQDHIHHVGVYVGSDTCIEAKGTLYGVVTSRLSHWDRWGELKMVDYSDAAELEDGDPSTFDPGGTDEAAAGTIVYAEVCNPQTWLNVRSGPGSSYPVVYQVQKGSVVEVLDAGEPDWWQIRYQGMIGWAFAEYLRILPQEPDDDGAQPEEGPGGDPSAEPEPAEITTLLDKLEKALILAGEALKRIRELIGK